MTLEKFVYSFAGTVALIGLASALFVPRPESPEVKHYKAVEAFAVDLLAKEIYKTQGYCEPGPLSPAEAEMESYKLCSAAARHTAQDRIDAISPVAK